MRNHNVAESEKENRKFFPSHLISYAALINHLTQHDSKASGWYQAKGKRRTLKHQTSPVH